MLSNIIASIIIAVIVVLIAAAIKHFNEMKKKKANFWHYMLEKPVYNANDMIEMLEHLNEEFGDLAYEIYKSRVRSIQGSEYEKFTALTYNTAFTDAIKRMALAYDMEDKKMFNIYFKLARENYNSLKKLKEEMSGYSRTIMRAN